jgi:hypothetical protein
MTWADQIDRALQRVGSPYTALDLLRFLREGKARLYVGERLHGALWWRDDGVVEVFHVAGTWNAADGDWLFEKMYEAVPNARVAINGRPGWERFLRMKGY